MDDDAVMVPAQRGEVLRRVGTAVLPMDDMVGFEPVAAAAAVHDAATITVKHGIGYVWGTGVVQWGEAAA